MDSFRRKLILSSISCVIGLKTASSKAQKPSNNLLDKENVLYHSTTYTLPKNPREGDEVIVAISQNCLINPPIIKFQRDMILGEKEDLTLDSLGIIRFKYLDANTGWILA